MDEHKGGTIVNALRNKIGSATALRNIFTREHVQAAQAVIDNARDNYFDTIEGMTAVFRAAAEGDIDPPKVYEATKSLKAQAEGLGFVFLMEVSNSLYKFFQEKAHAPADAGRAFTKSDNLIIRKHAEAIISTIVNRERGKGGMVEAGILNSLEILKRKYAKPES